MYYFFKTQSGKNVISDEVQTKLINSTQVNVY